MNAIPETITRPKATQGQGAGRATTTFEHIYAGIRVRDMAQSIRFYTDVLGMEIIDPLQSTPPTNGQVVGLRSPGSQQLLELNWYEPGSRFGPPYSTGEDLDHLAFACDDVSAAVAELERRGVEVVVHPREIGVELGWSEAFVKDPNGIWIELLTRKRGIAEPPSLGP